MKRVHLYFVAICAFIALSGALLYSALRTKSVNIESFTSLQRLPEIKPDYTNTVIPPNIAPLNFMIQNNAAEYLVKICSVNGRPIEIYTRTGKVKIPIRKWRSLLNNNRGQKLFFDVYAKSPNGSWSRYEPIVNTVANEEIDPYIAYRLINPIYNTSSDVGVYQRNLENYDQSAILHGKSYKNGCVNCHTFLNYDPDTLLLGIRGGYGNSTLMVKDDKINKIGTKFGHTSWHPSGRLISYSIYDVRQFFHTARKEIRDVIEVNSGLAYYSLEAKLTSTVAAISDKNQLETHPTWSPDGKYLYFVSAPMLWSTFKVPPPHYDEVQYSLMRISYDVNTDTWGELETVLSAEQTGLSIIFPKVSPDGRFIIVSMCQYSCFSLFQSNSDLYIIDLNTGNYEKLQCNSEFCESWHCWSRNNRWIVFSTMRPSGLFTRLYFSYIDKNGKASKAFILPQKDPQFYDSYSKIYNVPEFISGPVKASYKDLARTVRSPAKTNVVSPFTGATPKAPGQAVSEPWKQSRE